jgi:protein SCO1
MKYLIVIFLMAVQILFGADQKRIEIGIDEKLGEYIPLDTEFYTENGNKVTLKELMKKPTVITFVYYNCPGICTPLMTELAEVLNEVDLKATEHYQVLSISMDETETAELAAGKKKNYLRLIEKNFPEEGWRFLTGDSASIRRVTDAAGFYFKKEGKDFIHSGALIFVGTDGKISRYLFPNYSNRHGSYSILPFDFKMAVIETTEGKLVPTVATVLKFCFNYDPEGKTYVLNATRIFGAVILFAVLVFVVFLNVKPKKAKAEKEEVKTDGK